MTENCLGPFKINCSNKICTGNPTSRNSTNAQHRLATRQRKYYLRFKRTACPAARLTVSRNPMKCNLSVFLLLSILYSCVHSPEVEKQNVIYKITLASQEYMGNGPFRAIEIDSTLILKYFGGHNSDHVGFYYGKISQVTWDTIQSKIEKIGSNPLDTSFKRIVDDREIEMIIHSQTGVKHITAFQSTLPKSIVIEFDEILNLYKQIKLSKTDDSLKFETVVQEYNPPTQVKINFVKPKAIKE